MSSSIAATRHATLSSRPLPGVARVGLSRCQLELKAFFREKDAVMFIFALPVILMVIFGTVSAMKCSRESSLRNTSCPA
jgi:ABC-2 type transport system permease protein